MTKKKDLLICAHPGIRVFFFHAYVFLHTRNRFIFKVLSKSLLIKTFPTSFLRLCTKINTCENLYELTSLQSPLQGSSIFTVRGCQHSLGNLTRTTFFPSGHVFHLVLRMFRRIFKNFFKQFELIVI